MFTGLVEDLGQIVAVARDDQGARFTIRTKLADDLSEGDSVAVNGVCLTATTIDGDSFTADAMNETLSRTSLGAADAGSAVNLELPLRANAHLGGHIVQGHVDGVASVEAIRDEGIARVLSLTVPAELLRYVVEKGSVAVDGVSLTVSTVNDSGFELWLIPETLQRTNLALAELGTILNIEVDIVAKYVERLVEKPSE